MVRGGTPFVPEGGRLTFSNQLDLLGHASDGLALGGKPLTDRIVDEVKRLMIRHSKRQRIDGDVALAAGSLAGDGADRHAARRAHAV